MSHKETIKPSPEIFDEQYTRWYTQINQTTLALDQELRGTKHFRDEEELLAFHNNVYQLYLNARDIANAKVNYFRKKIWDIFGIIEEYRLIDLEGKNTIFLKTLRAHCKQTIKKYNTLLECIDAFFTVYIQTFSKFKKKASSGDYLYPSQEIGVIEQQYANLKFDILNHIDYLENFRKDIYRKMSSL